MSNELAFDGTETIIKMQQRFHEAIKDSIDVESVQMTRETSPACKRRHCFDFMSPNKGQCRLVITKDFEFINKFTWIHVAALLDGTFVQDLDIVNTQGIILAVTKFYRVLSRDSHETLYLLSTLDMNSAVYFHFATKSGAKLLASHHSHLSEPIRLSKEFWESFENECSET